MLNEWQAPDGGFLMSTETKLIFKQCSRLLPSVFFCAYFTTFLVRPPPLNKQYKAKVKRFNSMPIYTKFIVKKNVFNSVSILSSWGLAFWLLLLSVKETHGSFRISQINCVYLPSELRYVLPRSANNHAAYSGR
jgi:hypothetical protein